MNCMQHAGGSLLATAYVGGLADDAAVDAIRRAAGGRIVALRLLLPAEASGCRCGCGGAGPSMVALDPADEALPRGERTVLGQLAPGVAVADEGWEALIGGTVALAGRDVRILASGALSGGISPGPIVLLLSDLMDSIAASRPQHLPVLRTLAVVCGHPHHALAMSGWTVLPGRSVDVPVRAGLPEPSDSRMVDRELMPT